MAVQDIIPPLKLEGLVTFFRQDVDDLPGDTVTDVNWKNNDTGLLWKNQEIVRYANAAHDAFCMRQPIYDANSVAGAAINRVAVLADIQRHTYSERILAIHAVKFVETSSGDEHRLLKRTRQWMDLHHREWDLEGNAATSGNPTIYVEDYDLRSMDLWPIQEADGSLHLTVSRLPIKYMQWKNRHLDGLEIEARHHFDLLDFMLYLAYLKRDSETEDKQLSADALDRFNVKVGEPVSARLLRVRRQERNNPRRARVYDF